jgi:hypothetical protein
MTEEPQDGKDAASAVGAGVAIGAGIGAVLLVLTDSPVWIGVGAAVGAALGASWQARQP